MKAKSKSSKTVMKKPTAKKKIASTVKKKRVAVKPAKKVASAKKTRKASSRKTIKRSTAKKKTSSTPQKKKTPLIPVMKPVPAETPATIIEKTRVTAPSAQAGNGDRIPSVPPSGIFIGKVTHYDSRSHVAVIELEAGSLQVGDRIQIKGPATDFEQVVDLMEIKHQTITSAQSGQTVSVKVREIVREQDEVYKREGPYVYQ